MNIAIFLISHKYLVFPLLHEEQRMDNAPYILFYVIPSFILVSVITLVIYRCLAKRTND